MKHSDKNAIVLIPSLEPDERLTAYVDQLYALGLNNVLVVDDGSGLNYQPNKLFTAIPVKTAIKKGF